MNKICQNCRQPNPPEAAFCLNCAAPLAGATAGGGQQNNQQWNQPNFGGGQAGQNFAPPPATGAAASQRAMTAAGLAFAGLVCCGPLTSIPAAIVGWMEIDAIKKGQSPPTGMKFAQFGLWGGIVITVLQGGAFLLWVLFAALSDPYAY